MKATLKKAVNSNIIEFNTATKEAENVLEMMTNATPATSKSKIPIIYDKEFFKTVDTAIELKKEIENLTNKFEIEGDKIRARARKDYATGVKSDINSYKLQGSGTNTITVSFKNQFKEIPLTTKAVLQSLTGDKYDELFTESYQIEMIDTSVERIQEMIGLIGKEKFMNCFKIKKSIIKPCENMNKLQFELGDEIQTIVQQYKGSIKL